MEAWFHSDMDIAIILHKMIFEIDNQIILLNPTRAHIPVGCNFINYLLISQFVQLI